MPLFNYPEPDASISGWSVNHPEPDAPISEWTVSRFAVGPAHPFMSYATPPEEVEVRFTIKPCHTMRDALEYLLGQCKCRPALEPCTTLASYETKPKDVFINGPVTGVVFEDGKKVMTRSSEFDLRDSPLALLNCYWRKRDRNRGHSDAHYEQNRRLSRFVRGVEEYFESPCLTIDEMRDMAKQLEFLADAYEIIENKKNKE